MSTTPVNPQHVDPMECTKVTAACPVEASIYGYYPNLPATYFFVIIFGFCLIGNIAFGVRYGKATATYTLAMVLATAAALVGNAGRIPMHDNPFNIIGFQIQICCLTLSPAFNSAAIYLMFKHIVRHFGREWSRIRPKYYTWGFITADILALIFQGAGGGIAATSNDNKMLNVGTDLMIVGIVWQVVTLLIFGIMITDYAFRRYKSATPLSDDAQTTLASPKFRIFAYSLPVIYVTIFTRCVYRIAEMVSGWKNPVMQDEITFLVLDCTMVATATLLQTFVHPGLCFPALGQKHPMGEEKDLSDSSAEQVV